MDISLRGINLGANSKCPVGWTSWDPLDRDVSFIGRPLPLDKAHVHLAQLKQWGFNLLRLCVTWEAIEHAGCGIYDSNYIAYIVQLCEIAGEYGFKVFIDPHQDVWSRSCGGSGAPSWTLDMVGLDDRVLTEVGAAVVQSQCSDAEYPPMVWTTNYSKLATCTMFTCFFGGDVFAPLLKVYDPVEKRQVSIQDLLQGSFIRAMTQLATAIQEAGLVERVVVGFQTMNEPHHGMIGVKDLDVLEGNTFMNNMPTLFESFRAASGQTVRVRRYISTVFGYLPWLSKGTINPHGVKAWTTSCLWEQHSVWNSRTNQLTCPDYFTRHPKTHEHIDFDRDCFVPFVKRYVASIRAATHPTMPICIEPRVLHIPPTLDLPNIIYEPHWYDGLTLMTRRWMPYFTVNVVRVFYKYVPTPLFALVIGPKQWIRDCFADQIRLIKETGQARLGGNVPMVLGEIGIPFDMAPKSWEEALDASLSACEANLVPYTLWTYAWENTTKYGDGWNKEDLSIVTTVDGVCQVRAWRAAVRPFPRRIVGVVLESRFDMYTTTYHLTFDCNHPDKVEIVLPGLHYPTVNVHIQSGTGTHAIHHEQLHPSSPTTYQILIYTPTSTGLHSIKCTPH
jgi:hypothetical protein